MPKFFSILLKAAFVALIALLATRGALKRFHPELLPKAEARRDLNFSITQSAHDRGLDFVHQKVVLPDSITITPWIQALGASISVVDVNHDGFMDIYLTNSAFGSKNALYVNDGHGHFTEEAAKYNLADLNQDRVSQRSLFFDCDNDGRRDMLQISNECPRIWHQNEDNTYSLVENKFPTAACGLKFAATAADVDGDGALDLVLAGYPSVPGQLRVLPMNLVDGTNGGEIAVMKNDGHCHFSPIETPFDAGGHYFFTALGVGDLRGTGHADYWFGTDYTTDKVFLNQASGTAAPSFERAKFPYSNATSGMNAEVMYLEEGENPFVHVSQAYQPGYNVGGNNFWQYDGQTFRNHAIERGLHECGWSWGGRAIDLDNSGHLDLIVANGFVSGTGPKNYWYPFSVLTAGARNFLPNPSFWPNMKGADLSGHQRDCLYLNVNNHFENISEEVGVDDEKLDGRGVVAIDPENKGVQDFAIVNQGGPLRYYTVTPKTNNHWIGFSLESMRTNREAIGAKVTVVADGHRFVRENYNSNSFASQNDPRLHVGLGAISKIERVEVRWPDGRQQAFADLAVDQYHHLTED